MARKIDPSKRSMPFDEWPMRDQDAWHQAVRLGDILDGQAPAAHWAERTKETNIQHYGRWLGWLAWAGILDPVAAPADRVSRERVSQYYKYLRNIVAPKTQLSMLVGLKVTIKAMAPDRSWRWLQDASNRLQINAAPSREKRLLVRSTAEIYGTALAELDRVRAEAPELEVAIAYRDALMLALLAARPLRVKNMTAIEIGRHLCRNGDDWHLYIEAWEVKNRAPIDFTVPERLVPYLEHYLAVVRPVFPGADGSPRLWLNQYGPNLGRQFVYFRITKLTKRLFGQAINPHLLRDCAATTLAEAGADIVHTARPYSVTARARRRNGITSRPINWKRAGGSMLHWRISWPRQRRVDMRTAIYARYSSDLQSDASIDDQVEVCRRYADLRGWTVTDVFADRAISGANSLRPGFQALKQAANDRKVDIVLAESLDRLSRRVADIAGLHDDLSFHGIAMHTVATGEVNALLAGILGSVGQQYLLDLRDKTRRGLLGRVLAGKSGGGLAYGYSIPDDDTGARVINEAEAAVVRRIFEAFVAGQSPRAIAKQLNADGIPGPRGRPWRDTTIRGQRDRGTGLLNNDLYIGCLVWNRCSYVKNPRTGKRQARPNPPDQWESVQVPSLRIIDQDLWIRAKQRQDEVYREMARDDAGNALNRAHRRKFLFSGLLKCGVCGGGYTVIAKDRYGCANRRSKGTCHIGRTVKRQNIEGRILGGLKEYLLVPEMVEVFVEEFQAEINRLADSQDAQRQADAQALAGVERKIAAILAAVEDGLYSPSMKQRLTDLEARKQELAANLAATPKAPVRVLPNLAELYADKVANLADALNDEAIKPEAVELIRSLITRIDLVPDDAAPNGLRAEVHGDLAAILAFADGDVSNVKLPGSYEPGSQFSVVAGVGFEPTTFRL